MREYDLIGDRYAQHRSRSIGIDQIDQALSLIKDCRHVLDLGCGDGLPIAAHLRERCARIVGVDSSSAMVRNFTRNIRGGEAIHGDMATVDIPAIGYDLVCCWGALFHLEPEAQTRLLQRVPALMNLGGCLLFTSGREAGACTGAIGDVSLAHYSLSQEAYVDLLTKAGLTFVSARYDQYENYIYLFTRP